MTVLEYLNRRNSFTYGKKVRILDTSTGKGSFDWLPYKDAEIKKLAIKTQILVIYI